MSLSLTPRPPVPLSIPPSCLSSPKHDKVGGGPDFPVHEPRRPERLLQIPLGVAKDLGRAAAVQHRRVADEARDGEGGVHHLVDHALLEDLLDARSAFASDGGGSWHGKGRVKFEQP